MPMLRLALALIAFCVLASSAGQSEAASNLPSLALDPPPLPSSSGLSLGSENFAVSSAPSTQTPPADPKPGVNATIGSVHVSLHMMGGAWAGGVIRP